ncbi:MAG: S-adenosyl-l-methionine hydroxide adenosyltransferase family protein [Lachnospiraceae bacterium]
MAAAIVFQSDFGLVDGAVSAMHGVAVTVSPSLKVFDLTHEIPQYDIWEASYRLIQTIDYWPEGTVFVSVVDPGVGSSRRSIAIRTKSGKYVITPDNGTLTHIAKMTGIESARVIHEESNHLPHSELSYTFHGRDVYAYVGSRLAAGVIQFEDIGHDVEPDSVVMLPTLEPVINGNIIDGVIDVLDVRFGSLWTNIPYHFFEKVGVQKGDWVEVTIFNETRNVYHNIITYAKSFADVYAGESLCYINSLQNMAVAINQGSFAKAYNISTGNNWKIQFKKAPRFVYED